MRPPTPWTSSVAPISARATSADEPAKSVLLSREFGFFVIRVLAQETAALVRPQPRIQAILRKQAAVVAFLDDAPVVHDDQPVHRGDGRQPMRDRNHSLALHQLVQAGL